MKKNISRKQVACMRFAKKNMMQFVQWFKESYRNYTHGINLPSGDQNVEIFNGPTNTIGSTVRKKLLFLGRLHQKKGLDNLLEAWSISNPDHHNLATYHSW